MIDRELFNLVKPGLERFLGFEIPEESPGHSIIGVKPKTEENGEALIALRVEDVVVCAGRAERQGQLGELFDTLNPDLLFSIAGSYELSRITLPDGVFVWGPVPCYIANEKSWRPVADDRVVQMDTSQVDATDWNVFWHATGPKAEANFGIYERDELAAVASTTHLGDKIFEIGVEVEPNVKSQGLGTAVMSAAGNWILENVGVPFATAAAWNVPSGRSSRKVGMKYTYSAMLGWVADFIVPPQPLGAPLPGYPMYNRYPNWVINPDILEKPD